MSAFVWDTRPHGWTGNTFGPIERKPEPAQEELAAAALLKKAKSRERWAPIDPWRER